MNDILLVEDQEELARLIQLFLEQDGFSVFHASTGEAAIEYLKEHTARLVLLDLMLPKMDGFAVCRAVRERFSLPVVIISARTDRGCKLNGYELGADDYVEKPMDMELLTAKIHVLLKRSSGDFQQTSVIKSGGLTLDTEARKAYVEGTPIELNIKEYELLLLFLKNPAKTLHKDFIFNSIWGPGSDSESQTVTVHIKMLRDKIEKDPKRPVRIQTVWGVGYRYEEI